MLFVVLRWLDRRSGRSARDGWYRPGLLTGAFLAGYGLIRFAIEFTREPDAQLGLIFGPFSMGQLLSTGMVVLGAIVLFVTFHREPSPATP